MQKKSSQIIVIGAAIVDILVRPAEQEVLQTGSYAAEDIRMSAGADALTEAAVLAGRGKRGLLETVTGSGRAGELGRNS